MICQNSPAVRVMHATLTRNAIANCDRETPFPMNLSRSRLGSKGSKLVSGRSGSRSPLRVRPMEEGRKSSQSSRPAALPKPLIPGGCAAIGIIAAPLSEPLFVKRNRSAEKTPAIRDSSIPILCQSASNFAPRLEWAPRGGQRSSRWFDRLPGALLLELLGAEITDS